MSFCPGSLENERSHADPHDETTPNWPATVTPIVFLLTIPSLTNLPLLSNTWMRLLVRSQTYTSPSFEISTHVTSRNCRDGAAFGSYGPPPAAVGFSPYAPQCRLYAPLSASNTTMRWLPLSAT